MENKKKTHSPLYAFAPIFIFIAIYLGAGIYYEIQGVESAFYQVSSIGCMFIALLIAFLMGDEKMEEKFRIFIRGISNEGVVTMLLVYIFAGAFSGIASAMGGKEAVVNLGLSLVPVHFLAAGVFVVSAFMGTATGTSIGTISAVVPIAIGVAQKGGLNVSLVVGACVGGAMFGDNLSMISDTTIAATTTQGVRMKDKFYLNFLIALPAAICTIILLLIFGRTSANADLGDLSFNPVKIIPYVVIFVLAIAGLNVIFVLSLGIVSSFVIGMATGELTFAAASQSMYTGVTGMDEIFYLTLLTAGLGALMKSRGGIEGLIQGLRKVCRSARSSQLAIGITTSILDILTATNTVAIILCGETARDISREYRIDPRRTAALLDIFSCVPQGFLPYSGQLMISASYLVAAGYSVAAVDLIPFVWYNMLLLFFGILSIYVPYADIVCRKHPWNWNEGAGERTKQE